MKIYANLWMWVLHFQVYVSDSSILVHLMHNVQLEIFHFLGENTFSLLHSEGYV